MKYKPKHAKKGRVKRRVLMGITYYMLAQLAFAMLSIDSESNIPMILLLISGGWLGLFVLANWGEA